MECYNLDPKNNDVIDLYLKKSIEKINFSGHEWTSGILYGNSFATKDECKILLERTEFVKALDRNKKYTEDINEYENNIKEYMEKLE
jgi:hypothetical protein